MISFLTAVGKWSAHINNRNVTINGSSATLSIHGSFDVGVPVKLRYGRA